MTGIDRLSGTSPLVGAGASPATDARSLAAGAMGEVGHRVLAWVGAVGGGADTGAAAWSEAAGQASGFQPDSRELSRGGDVYGLRELASGIADRLAGTPAQEGALVRSLEGFTRAAVVQLAGLAGAPGDRQVAGVRDALEGANRVESSNDVDGVIARLDAATATLVRSNQG